MKQPAASKALCKAVRAAAKKIVVLRDSKLRERLEFAIGDDPAEAYRLGVEEAQGEIVRRLSALSDAAWQKPDVGSPPQHSGEQK